jgi:4-amino-4-deoxy-L-arabinose transferase-like glycosyltransferase
MFHSAGLFGNLKSKQVFWGTALALPALYISLGMLPLIGDESIRALVSLEMMLSGDYITPTMDGELYFNKPPLFNWVLIGFFRLFNRSDEFIVRLPTTLFLLIYCYTIYWWTKRELGRQLGILAALLFITCGRILFWDSFLGLIDIAYSWLVFLNFMLIWHFIQKRNFTLLFIISYALIAITFLLKGLPSLVFQAITLLTVFIMNKETRRLFSWQHITGILLLVFITGTYYLLYHLKNPDQLERILIRLFTESSQKSAIGAGIRRTMLHLFTFPFELIYHFVPWTLLVIFVFHKKIFSKALTKPFIRFCLFVFLTNMVVYWLSPITYPRYLLMLFPLIFIVFLYIAKMHAISGTPHYRFMKALLYWFMVSLVLASGLLPVLFASHIPVEKVYLKSLLVLAAGGLVLFFFHRTRSSGLLYSLGLALLISRVSFNLFLVPYRQSISWMDLCRKDAIEIAKYTKGQEMYLLTDTITIPNVYYLTRERNEILRYKTSPVVGPYFIVKDTSLFGSAFKKEFSMRVPYYTRSYFAGKFKHVQP